MADPPTQIIQVLSFPFLKIKKKWNPAKIKHVFRYQKRPHLLSELFI